MPDLEKIVAKEREKLMDLMDEEPYRIPRREVDENLLIATWNIAHPSNRKEKRALQYMADICERFDIVAIQEVKSDLTGLARLQELLPGNYKVLVSDPTGNNERMAFLYDKRTVINTGLVCEIANSGTIKEPIVFQYNRTPYCASFRAGRFDFVIVSVHIAEGSKHGEVGKALREKEITDIANHLKETSKKGVSRAFDPDYFVVGDFNIQESGDRFFNALTSGPAPKFVMPPGMDQTGTNFSRTKTYDKIAWLERDAFSFKDKFGVVPFGEVVYKEQGQPKDAAEKKISDHLPLWAEFRVNELTQELNQIINRKN